jgi:hypothetical protein
VWMVPKLGRSWFPHQGARRLAVLATLQHGGSLEDQLEARLTELQAPRAVVLLRSLATESRARGGLPPPVTAGRSVGGWVSFGSRERCLPFRDERRWRPDAALGRFGLEGGAVPQSSIPAGTSHGSRTTGPFTLAGTTSSTGEPVVETGPTREERSVMESHGFR